MDPSPGRYCPYGEVTPAALEDHFRRDDDWRDDRAKQDLTSTSFFLDRAREWALDVERGGYGIVYFIG